MGDWIKAFNYAATGIEKFSKWFKKKQRRDGAEQVSKALKHRDKRVLTNKLSWLEKKHKARKSST